MILLDILPFPGFHFTTCDELAHCLTGWLMHLHLACMESAMYDQFSPVCIITAFVHVITFVISFAFYFNWQALFILDLPVVQLALIVEQSVPVF